MIKLKKIFFIFLIVPFITSCQLMSFFIIVNNSPNPIEITYFDWPERYVPEPRIGYLDDIKRADYKLSSLPLADFKYGISGEIIVMVAPESAICIAGMQDINVIYANKYFSKARLFIKTVNGSIRYEGSEIIKLFDRDSRYNMNYVYAYN